MSSDLATVGAPPANADNRPYVKLAITTDSLGVLRNRTMPRSAVYRVFARNGDLLYVGCSSQLVRRMTQHTHKAHWWQHAAVITFDFMPRHEGFRVEALALATEGPLWNWQGNRRYFDPDVVAAREAYGPMPERFVHPGKSGRPAERRAS